MKRVVGNGLESRMRKKAGLDLKITMQREEENKRIAAQKKKYDSRGGPLYTLESKPSNMLHLGGDNFITISFFLGQTRVHVRRYVTDEEGFLHPTKDGVSVHPAVWNVFQQKIGHFKPTDQFLVIEKDLCVSHEKTFYVLQKMFQWKNYKFQFQPESVSITCEQMCVLENLIPQINEKVKEHLIKDTLAHFVSQESNHEANDDYQDISPLTESLSKCLTNSLSTKISELFHCLACKGNYSNSDFHSCVLTSREEKFEMHFDEAFYSLDWCQLAKDFYVENAHNFRVSVYDFFACLDANVVLNNVKQMYINEEENMLDKLMLTIQ